MLTGVVGAAQAQAVSSPDTAQMQFALNLQYLTTNFVQLITYGTGRQLPAEFIRGGESTELPGVPATSAKSVQYTEPTFIIQSRVREIADDHWWRTQAIRAILRGDAPAQKAIDYSAATFTTMFRLAGAIAPTATFDPYESPTNLLLALDVLLGVQASVYAGMLPNLTNEIVQVLMASMAASAANGVATVRSMIVEWAPTTPGLLTMADQLATWRDRVDGTSMTDVAMSPTMMNGQSVTRIAPTDADGLYLGRTPAQALNVLYMSSSAVSQGGFFPTGINGTIKASSANA